MNVLSNQPKDKNKTCRVAEKYRKILLIDNFRYFSAATCKEQKERFHAKQIYSKANNINSIHTARNDITKRIQRL